MKNEIIITNFSEEHIEEALEILKEYHEFHSSNFPDYFKNIDKYEETEYLKGFIKEENSYGYVALKDKKVIGIALFGLVPKPFNFQSPEVAYIYEIIIKENMRSKGIGEKLFKKVVEFSQTMGIDKVELEIKDTNQRGIAFYKRLGFYDYSKTMFLDI